MAASDEQLWRRAAEGDADAFGQLYDRHANTIYNYLFRRTGDWAVAEDLTASVFLSAWKKRQRVVFSDSGAVLPWLYGVAANVLRNHDRGLRRFGRAVATLISEPRPRTEADAAERALDEELMRSVLAAVNRLPPPERDVLTLCVFAEVSYEEAALALQIPIGTVRSRLSRARRRLAELSVASGHEEGESGISKVEANDGAKDQSSPVSRTAG